VDRPLTAAEQAEVRQLSTRARITATSFTNEYHRGDFKGSPDQMMQRYYDAHLYLANWGTHRVMLRLPRTLLDPLRRQQILGRTDGTAPRLVAVITEASLLYQWGTRDDRRAQITHLAAMSRRPNVELRLLRFAGGHHPGMISQINLFDFPDDDDPSVVYLDGSVKLNWPHCSTLIWPHLGPGGDGL